MIAITGAHSFFPRNKIPGPGISYPAIGSRGVKARYKQANSILPPPLSFLPRIPEGFHIGITGELNLCSSITPQLLRPDSRKLSIPAPELKAPLATNYVHPRCSTIFSPRILCSRRADTEMELLYRWPTMCKRF